MARILIVDDEPDVLAAMKASLEDSGYGVIQASDGGEVLGLATEHSPELIFLDLNMPRVDGFDALMNLKADARTKDIPVIVVSAKGRPEDRLRTRAMGATDYINKPWADGELGMRANLALMAAARKLATGGQTRTAGLQQRITEAGKPPVTRRVVTFTRPAVRRTIVYQHAVVAAPRPAPVQQPEAASPKTEPANGDAAGASAAAAKDQTRLAAARFIVQHEYSSNQQMPTTRADSKSAIILSPIEDPDWVVRFDTFDSPAAAAQAPGDPYRFVYGVRGASPLGAQFAIFAEWELADRVNCARFEANRTALFEIHRRQLSGLVSEWLLKRLDDSPRYTVLALFGDEDATVRFRAFNPPAQFTAVQMQAQAHFGASELFGQCACRVKRPGQP